LRYLFAYPRSRTWNRPAGAAGERTGCRLAAAAAGIFKNMAVLGWLWLASPFVVIGVILHDPELLALVSAHHRRCQIAGWTGAAIMLLGVTVVPGVLGSLMFVFGTPASGLAVWARGDDGDGGGEPAPDVPPVDWGDLERSFWGYVRGRSGRPPRPRTPFHG
jgi:hypothetical protein